MNDVVFFCTIAGVGLPKWVCSHRFWAQALRVFIFSDDKENKLDSLFSFFNQWFDNDISAQ